MLRVSLSSVHLVPALMFLVACNRYEVASRWNTFVGDTYALDAISRDLAEGEVAGCHASVQVIDYRGDVIRYQTPVKIAAPFADKLRAFERSVSELARKHYGRAPDRLLHFGARACRSVRGNGRRLSEHALGNALDLTGFQWLKARPNVVTSYPHAFTVTIDRHWLARSQHHDDERHRAFLHELVERIRSQNSFRGVIGPGREGHADHLHLDQAPWSYWLF